MLRQTQCRRPLWGVWIGRELHLLAQNKRAQQPADHLLLVPRAPAPVEVDIRLIRSGDHLHPIVRRAQRHPVGLESGPATVEVERPLAFIDEPLLLHDLGDVAPAQLPPLRPREDITVVHGRRPPHVLSLPREPARSIPEGQGGVGIAEVRHLRLRWSGWRINQRQLLPELVASSPNLVEERLPVLVVRGNRVLEVHIPDVLDGLADKAQEGPTMHDQAVGVVCIS